MTEQQQNTKSPGKYQNQFKNSFKLVIKLLFTQMLSGRTFSKQKKKNKKNFNYFISYVGLEVNAFPRKQAGFHKSQSFLRLTES